MKSDKALRSTECHPDRLYRAKGLCASCYAARFQSEVLVKPTDKRRRKIAECHADRWAVARGLCRSCYHNAWIKGEVGSTTRSACVNHADRLTYAKGLCRSCYNGMLTRAKRSRAAEPQS